MLTGVQVLRGLAAYMVVLVHLTPFAAMAGIHQTFFDLGNGGVDLFFIISGLVMVLTTVRRRPKPVEFMSNRITRIVPLYWVITAIVFMIALISPSLLQGTRANFLDLVKSMLFIPYQRGDGAVAPIVFAGWTLNYEMFFYAIFAVGLLFKRIIDGMVFIFAIFFALVLIGLLVRSTSLASFYTQPIILEFTLGMALGLALPWISSLNIVLWRILALICISASAFIWAHIVWPDGERLLTSGLPAFLVVFSVLLLERRHKSQNHLLQLFGDASYSIYLTHFFVTQSAVDLAGMFHLQSIAAIGGAFMLTLIAVGVVGVGTHYTVEMPLIRRARLAFK